MANRWITYQRERFPILAHAPLVAAFSFSAVCLSSLLRGDVSVPEPRTAAVAFGTAFLFFLQLRIADEFKDFEDDTRFRPYRAVPRGLISLRELGYVGVAAAVLQFVLALWLDAGLLIFLGVAWLYLWVMTHEFFAAAWLKTRPVAYMTSHMVIVPLIDLYATACDWWVGGLRRPPHSLSWFLLVSFFNGIVIEIGRKLRAPGDEEEGVETYTALWGRRAAVASWLAAIVVTAFFAGATARAVGTQVPVAALLIVLIALAVVAARRFLLQPTTARAKSFEVISGVWTLLMYLSLGAAPLLLRAWTR